MSEINTEYLNKCLLTLKKSYELLKQSEESSIEFEMYRNSLVKGFEMTIEQSAKLLRKKLTPYFSSKKAVDALTFKDLFRYAAKHSLLNAEEVERWFKYRDNRNSTAHDYGEQLQKDTLVLIDDFVQDTQNLIKVIQND
ncbi:MAG: nucleotidyltransferase substrate binding protein [Clostridium sp.]|jgi:hypothetical protein|nr:nucleotidyltransferase substrate binding protein [Clostridium sp.]